MTVVNDSLDITAKLLAMENITVVRDQVRTASFDVKTRVLTLPQWKCMTPSIESMLVSHEVGHALFTTNEYITAVENNSNLEHYLNIIEDVRVEKMMKRKYPGIRKQMNQGYKELNEQDFFGLSKIQDLSSLNLIDRINVYFKAGYQCGVEFDAREKIFVDLVEKTETVGDVIALAKEIYDYSKKQIKDRKRNKLLQNDGADEDYLGSDRNNFHGYENTETDNDAADDDDDDADDDEELKSITEESFQENLENIADVSTKCVYYGLDERRLVDRIVDYKTILAETASIDNRLTVSDRKDIEKFKIDSSRVVSYLIKEFEMRKSAMMYKYSTTSKSGSLDTNKIWSYKLQEDIFKRMTRIPEGKNHGMIFLLDWSGSMQDVLDDTIKQVVNLAMFCQRAHIPYQVLAFTDNYRSLASFNILRDQFLNSDVPMFGNVVDSDFALLELFSSKMNTIEFNTMINRTFNTFYINSTLHYTLGGTPLNESLSYLLGYIPEFMKKNNTENMSLITLTDGAGGALSTPRLHPIRCYTIDRKSKVKNFIKDPLTKKDYPITREGKSQTEAIVRMIKDRYHINIVGFYICPNKKSTLRQAILNNLDNVSDTRIDDMIDTMRHGFKENGFASIKNTGRDDLFIVPQNNLTVKDVDITVEKDHSANQIAKMFSKQMSDRKTSRVLLTRFIDYVA